jgi:hypothetical protein
VDVVYIIFAVPAVAPVTTPVLASTVAIAGSSEDQDPPGVPEELAVDVAPILILDELNDVVPALHSIVKLIVL